MHHHKENETQKFQGLSMHMREVTMKTAGGREVENEKVKMSDLLIKMLKRQDTRGEEQ